MADLPKDSSQPASSDPSMEDILASIRRILSEEETHDGTPSASAGAYDDDVLVLDSSMMVQVPPSPALETTNGVPAAVPPAEQPKPATGSALDHASTLVAPEVAAAAASSVGSLMRNIAAERSMQIHSSGPTIEDIVRAELRPLLKQWLDANLETLVERLVRAELERVVSRALS